MIFICIVIIVIYFVYLKFLSRTKPLIDGCLGYFLKGVSVPFKIWKKSIVEIILGLVMIFTGTDGK